MINQPLWGYIKSTPSGGGFFNFNALTHVESPAPKAFRINTDGELTVRTPAKFRVIPRPLTVYVPPPGLALGEINGLSE